MSKWIKVTAASLKGWEVSLDTTPSSRRFTLTRGDKKVVLSETFTDTSHDVAVGVVNLPPPPVPSFEVTDLVYLNGWLRDIQAPMYVELIQHFFPEEVKQAEKTLNKLPF